MIGVESFGIVNWPAVLRYREVVDKIDLLACGWVKGKLLRQGRRRRVGLWNGIAGDLAWARYSCLDAACIEINGGTGQKASRVDEIDLYLNRAWRQGAADVDGSNAVGAYKGIRVLTEKTARACLNPIRA